MRTVGMIPPAGRPKPTCPVCGKEFAGEKKLAEHREKEHPAPTLK